jgi:hypothetical protein
MKTKPSVIFAIMFVLTLSFINNRPLNAQLKNKDYYSMDYTKWMVLIPGNDSVAPFYISAKPVTNKEYILYLVWTERVFINYPESLFSALPGFKSAYDPDKIKSPFSDSASFRYYLDHSESYVADYMFNPQYLNYPIIGVSWEQADKFCHWLSDRYNEYSLIDKKVLEIDPNQVNESNFSTESFIFGQYEGVIRKPLAFGSTETSKGFDYVKYLLRPSFHLAARYELNAANHSVNTFPLYTVYDEYTTKGSEFLKPFYDYFLPESKGLLYISNPEGGEPFWLVPAKAAAKIDFPKMIKEWCLDSYIEKEENSIPNIYRKFSYEPANFQKLLVVAADPPDFFRKDRFGKMRYIITGENKNREIEIMKSPESAVESFKKDSFFIYDNATKTVVNSKGDIFTCFRVAVNAIKK